MTDTHTSRPDSLATTEGGEASSAATGVHPADLAGMHALLEQVTLAQLIARKPPTTVTVVPAEWTIERALQQCAAKNLLATPVVDANNSNCYGFFDINDALKAVCSWFDIHNVSNHDRIARLQAAGTKMHSTPVRDIVGSNTDGQLLETAHTNSTLMQVLVDGFLNPADDGPPCHRIAVYECQQAGQLPQTRITHIVTQTDIIRFVAEHLARFPSLASMHVERLCPPTKAVLCVPSDMPAINALAAAYGNRVSSVGIIDITAHGALCGMLSISDLRGLQASSLDMLALPVLQFLQEAPASLRASAGTQLSSEVYGLKGGTHQRQVPWCRPHTTLGEVVEYIVERHLHRVYVVDSADRPVGIVTLSDILELLTSGHAAP